MAQSDDLRALERQLAALERRVESLEDELAIHRLIVRYGFAVDTGDADATAELFTEDTLFDVDGRLIMRGRDGVSDMVRGERHQSLHHRPRPASGIRRGSAGCRGDHITKASRCGRGEDSRSPGLGPDQAGIGRGGSSHMARTSASISSQAGDTV